MFFYLSLLVELGVLDEVRMEFLIVGHTHASIDQYFSILSTAIRKALFIGSPMALWALYDTCRSNPNQAILQRQIRIVYDYVRAFAPYLNKKISYYQIPHCFCIKYFNL